MLLHAKRLSFSYKEKRILHEISFSLPKGHVHMIIGPNGSGKSTLLKILAGLLSPESGQLSIKGEKLQRLTTREKAKMIAYVPQMLPTGIDLTVEELTLLGRTPHQGWLGLEQVADRKAAQKAMHMTHVADMAKRRLKHLSGGEYHRAFIAKALCQQAQILLLDEPTAALDPAHALQIMDIVAKSCREEGRSAVIVSHDLNMALQYADTVTLLERGHIAGQGCPEEVLTPPLLQEVYGCTFCRVADQDGILFIAPKADTGSPRGKEIKKGKGTKKEKAEKQKDETIKQNRPRSHADSGEQA